MTLAAQQYPSAALAGSEAILNALPNPVLLIAPDGKIADANIAAESFFEISTQFLKRQSLKELVPFGSPLLALIEQVKSVAFDKRGIALETEVQIIGEAESFLK